MRVEQAEIMAHFRSARLFIGVMASLVGAGSTSIRGLFTGLSSAARTALIDQGELALGPYVSLDGLNFPMRGNIASARAAGS